MKEVQLLGKTKGVNSAISSGQTSWTAAGFKFLASAVNVDITDGHRISRRKGFSRTDYTEAGHSLYTHNGVIYCVYNDNICAVNQGGVMTVIANGYPNQMHWCGIGNRIFFNDGIVTGYIEDLVKYAWEPGTYYGPSTVSEFVAPPPCKHIELHLGRAYLADGPVLWFTEPMYYTGLNKATDYIVFPGDIKMVLSIESHLIVATDYDVYALAGGSPDNFLLKSIQRSSVIEGTGLVVDGTEILGEMVTGKVAIFTTRNGIFAIINDGSIFDITENRLRLPAGSSGTAYIEDNFYTVLIDE